MDASPYACQASCFVRSFRSNVRTCAQLSVEGRACGRALVKQTNCAAHGIISISDIAFAFLVSTRAWGGVHLLARFPQRKFNDVILCQQQFAGLCSFLYTKREQGSRAAVFRSPSPRVVHKWRAEHATRLAAEVAPQCWTLFSLKYSSYLFFTSGCFVF